ncbi:hypothetical protein [Paenibacillus sp. Root444D2]|uniref:hypothetical protein n=1 Tax=Paenibacillus sp. Root444D2 TaxID=1736538 RepID=UPI00070B6AD7|nr:hypothetical protein [Paenibacillus sp. Root444D2]KQX48553.1 hypothetical protein ASD40_10185 [Paenibacillus sp. Root444D2]
MRRWTFFFISYLLLLYSVFIGFSITAEAARDTSILKLPEEIYLSEKLTPIYDDPEGSKLYDATPQFVRVINAEVNWDQKLLENQRDIWFEIETTDGNRWVNVDHPQFTDAYYNDVLLTGEEQVYEERFEKGKRLGAVSAQTVRAIYSANGDYLIQTWLGYNWIHPTHPVYEHAHVYYGPVGISISVTTPMFTSPDAGGVVMGWLSSQDLVSSLRVNDDWYYVDSWQGPRWVNINIGYPKDLRIEDKELKLTLNTPVYEHPNKKAKVLATLSPQTVDVYERGSGWQHIHSQWLGDAWIYAADSALDPELYELPSQVEVKQISSKWSEHTYDFGAGWRGSPFATGVSAVSSVFNQPFGFIGAGDPIDISFQVANVSEDDLTLVESTSFEIQILQMDRSDRNAPGTLVWSGKLPALNKTFPKVGDEIYSQELSFKWDQKDVNGKQVPFGDYQVTLKRPTMIQYKKTNSDVLLEQKEEGHMRSQMQFTIAAP